MNETDSNKISRAPEPAFVRDNYDALLKRLPGSYTSFRWEDTDVSRFHFAQSRRALVAAMAHMPKHFDRALEVGGGDGVWTQFFAEHVDSLDFLDISSEMLAQAKAALSRFTSINYIHSDFLSWEPKPASYDLAMSFRNIEYMPDKGVAIKRFADALRPGGIFVVSTKSPEFDWGGYFKGKALHGGQISIRPLITLLQVHSFKILGVYPAIIGKKTRYAPIRFFWHCLHYLMLRLPAPLMPLWALKYISESFLIVAQKI